MVAALCAPLILAAAPASSAWPEFDDRVDEAKTAMMSAPQAALAASEAALRVTQGRTPSPQRERAEATAGWLKGEALTRLNRPRLAQPVIEAALAKAQAVAPGEKLEGDLLKARGSMWSTLGRVQPALVDLQAAFRVFQKAEIPRSQAIVLQDIGAIYADARDYAHMAKYYEQSSEIFKDDGPIALAAHNNLGNAYRELGRTGDALKEFSVAIGIARKMDSPALIVRVLPNLAAAQTREGDYTGAEATLNEAFRDADADAGARAWKQPYLWGARARLEARRGRLAEARAALESTFAGQDIAHTSLPYREFHDVAWRVYSRLGDPGRALAHLAAFKRLDDEARDLAASTNAALMGAEFDFANQDLKIARLRAGQLQNDVELARSRERSQRNLTIVLAGAGGVVFTLVLIGFLNVRRSRNVIRASNEKLEITNTALERALKAKSQFLATTSHEIRTPLNGILGMTQVLLADATLPAPARGRVELLHGAGQTMRALVDDLLDLAKMETGRITVSKAPLRLDRLIDDATKLWRAEAQNKGLFLTLDADDLPPAIVEDEARLRQVLFNLMSNAIKFTEAGGVILRVRLADERIAFDVTDTGIGIGEQDCDRIFEAFTQVDGGTTRRHGGTGLGLAICRDVARALGGDVEVCSRPGQGSTFTLSLPLLVHEAEVAMPADVRAPASLAEARFLIVELNPLARSILRAVLQPHVAHVEVAADLATAARSLEDGGFNHLLVAGEALGREPEAAAAALDGLRDHARTAGVSLLLTSAEPALKAALPRSETLQLLDRPISSEALLSALRRFCEAPGEAAAETHAAAA